MFVYIKLKYKPHFGLQWSSSIVQKSDHVNVSFLYPSSLHAVLLLWTLGTRDFGCYFCHALTPSCTIHNYWQLSSYSANFLMAPSIIIPGREGIEINDHKISTFSNMSATPNEFLSVKKQYQTSFLLWIKTILHFESTLSVTAPPFHSFRLTHFCPPWSLLFCKSIHQCL